MQARKAGIIGGTLAVALACALGGTFAVTQALAIGDEAGNAIDVSPLVVGASASHPQLVTMLQEQVEPEVVEEIVEVAAPPAFEVVTAPEPRRATSAVPPVVVTPPAPPAPPAQVAPPAAPAPTPERPAGPQRPSASDVKRWLETGAYDEAFAWAKAHGWSDQNIRDVMREYAPNSGGTR